MKILASAFLGVCLLIAISEPALADRTREIRFADCPQKVRKTILLQAGNGRIDDVEYMIFGGRKIFIADVNGSLGRDKEIYVHANGNLIKIRQDAYLQDAPLVVQNAASQFPGNIDDVDMETANGVITWQIEIERAGHADLNLRIAQHGRILSQRLGDDPYDLADFIPIAPEIKVTRGSGTNLISGAATQNFGFVTVRKKGSSKKFTITNTGNITLTKLSVRITGADAANFRATRLPRATLAPGKKMSFTIRFAPRTIGRSSAKLQIISNDANESPFLINLSGTSKR